MRFLLDENVRAELDGFLNGKGFDVKRLPKGAPDRALAAASREEKRLIVTNDEDFAAFPEGKLFGVVILRVPQRDADGLLAAFQRLLDECKDWKARTILVRKDQWESSPLLPKRRGMPATAG
jgi:predicted nuclease of predicted toxin-antitoxin system